jgi:acetyltransferase EpsM
MVDQARLVLIGGGGHASVVAEAVLSAGAHELVGFVDPEPLAQVGERLGLAHLGGEDALARLPGLLAVLGFGTLGPGERRRVAVDRLGALVSGWATVVHPFAWVSPTARLGEGSVVMAGAVIQSGAVIGRHCVVNTAAVIEHDVTLGDHVQIAPGAVVGGGTRVGASSFVGLGARVRDHVTIGSDCLVGMGAVVTGDVSDGSRVRGVPAR